MSFFNRYTQGSEPLAWWRGHPIYLSAFLGLFTLASMILTALLLGLAPTVVSKLIYDTSSLWPNLQLWTPLTYLFVNPVNFWTVVSAILWWRFGTEVEQYLGRGPYIKMLIWASVLSLATVTVLGWFHQTAFVSSILFLEWSTLVAFAVLFPHAQISIFVAKLSARVLVGGFFLMHVLQSLSAHQWWNLALYVVVTLGTLAFITHWQGRWTIVMEGSVPQKSFSRPAPSTTAPRKNSNPRGFQGSVDDLLDKISQKGMQSLSEEERDFLHQHSKRLAEKKD